MQKEKTRTARRSTGKTTSAGRRNTTAANRPSYGKASRGAQMGSAKKTTQKSAGGNTNTRRAGSTTASRARSASEKTAGTSTGLQESQLMKLFENELKDIYWAEKALTKALPKMIKKATSADLVKALKNHLKETEKQVSRVEQVFKVIGKPAKAKKCEAMQGLIDEGEEIMTDSEAGPMRDAGIISAAQKVEHYEIASYGTLRQFAETLRLNKAVSLLEQTLEEEKMADDKLTEVAVSCVNLEAAEQDEESEEEDDTEDEDANEESEYASGEEQDDEDEDAAIEEDEEEEEEGDKDKTGKNKGTFF